MKHTTLLTLITSASFIIITIAGIEGIKITRFEIPAAVYNGTGPVELTCIYKIDDLEKGLVIKWYHNLDQIYQWIPPMAPQDTGVILGFTEYPVENINRPLSHSIIRLKQVNFAMTGEYTCSVSTLYSETAQIKQMTIYVPNQQLKMFASSYNDTHVNLTCVAEGGRPRPHLTIIISNQQLHSRNVREKTIQQSRWIHQETIVPNFVNPVIVECEIHIPGTGYRKREKLLYYPSTRH